MTEPAVADFYFEFEQRYRGAPEEIRARLSVYRPLLDAVLDGGAPALAVDYGCGRGEWLQTVDAAGFVPLGVDTNADMVAACRSAGLTVEEVDALAHVRSRAPASIGVVSAFHVVEHLPIEQMLAFLAAARDALAPGGLLVLETPNPENLSVGACTFYSDPTHVRPLPPTLLRFCVEAIGFDCATVVRLNTAAELLDDTPSIARVVGRLIGASPDYAVVAFKGTDDAHEAALRRFVATASQPAPLDLAIAHAVDARADDDRRRVDALDAAVAGHGDALRASVERVETLQAAAARVDALATALDDERAARAALAEALEALVPTLDERARRDADARRDETEALRHDVASLREAVDALRARAAGTDAVLEALRARGAEADARIASMEAVGERAVAETRALTARIDALGHSLDEARLQNERLLASNSWRITAPLRSLARLLRSRP